MYDWSNYLECRECGAKPQHPCRTPSKRIREAGPHYFRPTIPPTPEEIESTKQHEEKFEAEFLRLMVMFRARK